MSTRKVNGIKVPSFSNVSENSYKLWKKKITLFISVVNHDYKGILESSLFVPRKDISVPINLDSRVPQEFIPKDPFEYTDRVKELISLDASLRSILVESMDSNMHHRIRDCVSATHMWETIEAIVEGTEDKNILNFLMSEYNEFKSLSVSSNKEGLDFKTMSLDELYDKLKTYEAEEKQRNIKHGNPEEKVKGSLTPEASTSESNLTGNEEATNDYYTLEELEKLEDQTMFEMASKCSVIKFRRNSKYKMKSSSGDSQDLEDGESTESVSSECCKEQLIQGSTYELCDGEEKGHSNSEMEKSIQAKDKEVCLRRNEDGQKKHKDKKLVSDEKHWNGTDVEEEKCNDPTSMETSSSQIDKMNRTKLPIRERIGSIPQFPIGVEVTIAEFIIVDGSGTPNPEVEEQQRDDVLLLIGDRIVDPIERPNAGPDDVDIEDVVLKGIVAEEDPMEDPDKNK
ncbi:hypothetical protein AgCh_012304 [Apium graveolens]